MGQSPQSGCRHVSSGVECLPIREFTHEIFISVGLYNSFLCWIGYFQANLRSLRWALVVQCRRFAVDRYMGFMENYRDPKNLQLEYSSFVGIEDHNHSRAFRELTTRSAEFTSKLPWGREFEPDAQDQNDTKSFSSLVVTSYVANVPPRGVNLPNCKRTIYRLLSSIRRIPSRLSSEKWWDPPLDYSRNSSIIQELSISDILIQMKK